MSWVLLCRDRQVTGHLQSDAIEKRTHPCALEQQTVLPPYPVAEQQNQHLEVSIRRLRCGLVARWLSGLEAWWRALA